MVNCGKCGQAGTDDAQYCSKCGSPLVEEAPKAEGRVEQFAQEVSQAGKQFEANVEHKSAAIATHFDRTFGPVGPVIIAAVLLIIMVFTALVLIQIGEDNDLFERLGNFLIDHLAAIFLVLLILSLGNYATRRKMKGIELLEPLLMATGVAFALWLALNLVRIIVVEYDLSQDFLTTETIWLIVLVVFMVLFITTSVLAYSEEYHRGRNNHQGWQNPAHHSQPNHQNHTGMKGLYRSNRDRFLGGVCGGIAEYFSIDPTIIRIVWVALFFVSLGTAILAYVILWIVVPRDPDHHW